MDDGAAAPSKLRVLSSRLLLVSTVVALLSGCGRSADSAGDNPTTSSILVTTVPTTVSTTAAPTTSEPRQLTYVVQSGDSLSVIAERFGLSTKELADFNAIADADTIKVGQELAIPPVSAETTTTAPASTETSADG